MCVAVLVISYYIVPEIWTFGIINFNMNMYVLTQHCRHFINGAHIWNKVTIKILRVARLHNLKDCNQCLKLNSELDRKCDIGFKFSAKLNRIVQQHHVHSNY